MHLLIVTEEKLINASKILFSVKYRLRSIFQIFGDDDIILQR